MHVASGPTMEYPLNFKKRNEIIKLLVNLKITNIIPKTKFLGKDLFFDKRVEHVVLFDNLDLMKILQKNFSEKGIRTKIRDFPYFEESSRIANQLIKEFSWISENHRPFAYICGGESTVRINGSGKGGRMQELIGYAIEPISKLPHSYILGIGSDGRDYVKGIAGAYANTDTYKKIKLNLKKYLEDNDSYNLHYRLGSLIKSPKNNLNVGDFVILLKN